MRYSWVGSVGQPGRQVACDKRRNLSCNEDLFIDGQVGGLIDPRGSRLTIGPNARVRANVNACAVVVQGKLEGDIQARDRVDLNESALVMGDIATQRISI